MTWSGSVQQRLTGGLWPGILLVLPLLSLAACVIFADPYWIFGDEHTIVNLRNSANRPAGWFGQIIGSDTVSVHIVVRRNDNIKLNPDSNSLMVDLLVHPKRYKDRFSFNPSVMRIEVNGVPLRQTAAKPCGCKGRFDNCSYRSTFGLDSEECRRVPYSAPEQWCVIDLDSVLAFDSVPLNIERQYGWLPTASRPWMDSMR